MDAWWATFLSGVSAGAAGIILMVMVIGAVFGDAS